MWDYFDDLGLHIGKKVYTGDCIACDYLDIGSEAFDTKVYHFPNGKYQVCYSSQRVFRVPGQGYTRPKARRSLVAADDSPARGPRVDNILRAKKRINQIILCNTWDYFMTFTFDDSKVDASDPSLVIKKAQKWLNNQVTRKGIGYLLVPEYHKNGNRIHLHALISNLGGPGLDLADSGTVIVKGIDKPIRLTKVLKRHLEDSIISTVYNVLNWKFGFSTAIPTYGSVSRLANYVMKYITKDLQSDDSQAIFGKYYWCSHNLDLYPIVELRNQQGLEWKECKSKMYYVAGSDAAFKYVNRLGDSIEEAPD